MIKLIVKKRFVIFTLVRNEREHEPFRNDDYLCVFTTYLFLPQMHRLTRKNITAVVCVLTDHLSFLPQMSNDGLMFNKPDRQRYPDLR